MYIHYTHYQQFEFSYAIIKYNTQLIICARKYVNVQEIKQKWLCTILDEAEQRIDQQFSNFG